MTYFIDGKDCMIAEWTFLQLAYVFVAARIYTRICRLHQRLDCSDYLLIVAALDALGLIICDTLTYRMGVLDRYTPSIKLSKISFASNYFYDFGLGFPKLSLLAFYWANFNLVGKRKTLPRMLRLVTIFVVVCYLASLFDDTFFCGSTVSVQWSQEVGACSVFYAQAPFILNFTLGLSCYLAIYSFSIALLWNASTAIALTFGFGALAIASGVARFMCLKIGTGQENLVYILSMVELTISIMVASLPGLKPLIKEFSSSNRSPACEATFFGTLTT